MRASVRFLNVVAALLLSAAMALAQRAMTAAQVEGFVKSSIQQKLPDKDVADLLKKIKLTEHLDERSVETLQGLGAGSRTVAALRELAASSAGLPAPAPPAPKPPRPVMTAPDSVTQAHILDGIREYALNYTRNLPNFICTQVTRREVDPTGTGDSFQSVDKIQEQLSYFEHHENYKVVMVSGKMVRNKEHEKLGGAVTSGEFGSIMAEIFDPDTEAEFDWDHLGKLDGRIMNVFSYRVRQPRSHYTIEDVPSARKIVAGYRGLVYANRDTNAIMRITLECEDLPRDFPIQDIKTDLWYDATKIGDQEFVLPLKWEMHSRDRKYLVQNSAEFALYRKFGAEATITFESPDPVPESKTKEEPVTPPEKKKKP